MTTTVPPAVQPVAMASRSVDQITDWVTWEEAAALFSQAGVSVRTHTLHRWAIADGLPMVRRGKRLAASFSDLLVAHANRYPAPSRDAAATVP